MFLIYPLCLQNFKKIKDQLLCHQINVKISSFCEPKLGIKNKFTDRIVNNIRFKWNLICMLGTWNSIVGIFKIHTKKKIFEKFEEFLSKQVWIREKLCSLRSTLKPTTFCSKLQWVGFNLYHPFCRNNQFYFILFYFILFNNNIHMSICIYDVGK